MGRGKVVVVGGGLGGLAAAIRLAVAGKQVTLVEQGERVGGKMNLVLQDGFTFDTGPSLVTMPFVLRDLFAVAGERMEDHLTLEPVEPLTRYFFPDGVRFDASADLDRMTAAVRALNPADADRYRRFLHRAHDLYDRTADAFLFNPLSWRSLVRQNPLDLLRIDALRTVADRTARSFDSPHLQQIFNRFATYNGSSPYLAPATLNVIAWVEYGLGGFYVRGGLYRIAEALAALAERVGVMIRLNTAAAEITVAAGRATGVRLTGGETMTADAVVVNADVVDAHRRLLPGIRPGVRRKLERLEPSLSGFVLLLGLDGRTPGLAHHNILFSADYEREFAQLRAGLPADDPTIYIAVPSHTDPELAPDGCEGWFILINAPFTGDRFRWTADATAAYRDLVLDKLARFGFDPRARLRTEDRWTPETLESRYGANRGAIYGLASNSRLTAFRRPGNRSPDVRGLYFASGSVHPGGGIPLVLLSGQHAATLLLADD